MTCETETERRKEKKRKAIYGNGMKVWKRAMDQRTKKVEEKESIPKEKNVTVNL